MTWVLTSGLQGKAADEIMKTGGFVPTSLILDLLVNAMASSGANRFLVDGFPRKLDQLQEFEAKVRSSSSMAWHPRPLAHLRTAALLCADPAC